MADLCRHIRRVRGFLSGQIELQSRDALSGRSGIQSGCSRLRAVGRVDCLRPVEVPDGERVRPIECPLLPAARPRDVGRREPHSGPHALGHLEHRHHVHHAVLERLVPGNGMAALRAADGPLVVAQGTRADRFGVEHRAQRRRRPHRSAVSGRPRLVRRLARRFLRSCGGGHRRGALCRLMLRDTPQSVGLPSIEKYKNDYPEDYSERYEREFSAREIFVQHILRNRLLWWIALANVFVYLLRYGVLDWAPTYLKEAKHFTVDRTSWAYFLYEWAGIPGTLLCGWISDRFFQGRRGIVGILFMVLVAVATAVYWLNPPGNPTVDIAALVCVGFLIYGPVMLIGLHALELVPKKAAGSAAGFTGMFGYLGGSLAANALVGYTVDSFGWDGGFILLLAGCVLAIACIVPTLRHDKRASLPRAISRPA